MTYHHTPMTHEQAAKHLGCTVAEVKRRVAAGTLRAPGFHPTMAWVKDGPDRPSTQGLKDATEQAR